MNISPEARDLHFQSIVVDAHCDTLDRVIKRRKNFNKVNDFLHIDMDKLQRGGVNLQIFAMFNHPTLRKRGFMARLDKMFLQMDKFIEGSNGGLKLITSKDQLSLIGKDNTVYGMLSIEGAHSIEGKLENLDVIYQRGVRLLGLTWNNSNRFASSVMDSVDNGLSNDGKELIKKLNSLGMVIDLSHSSTQTLYDTLSITDKPVIASHSCCFIFSDSPRNLTDDEIKAISRNQGVIGVNFVPFFLDQGNFDKLLKLNDHRHEKYKDINKEHGTNSPEARKQKKLLLDEMFTSIKTVNYKKVIDHIEHFIEVGGEDCVGLGSDFDGTHFLPQGLEDVTKMPLLTDEMLKRGWSKDIIQKILGKNMLRVLKDNLK
ncbi:MAG: dipeptidase [Acidobacteria bacterium]|nr:dipeptidase [Acidobacteriota bacterium]